MGIGRTLNEAEYYEGLYKTFHPDGPNALLVEGSIRHHVGITTSTSHEETYKQRLRLTLAAPNLLTVSVTNLEPKTPNAPGRQEPPMMEGAYTLRRRGWEGSDPAFLDYRSWAEMEQYRNPPHATSPGDNGGVAATRATSGAFSSAGIRQR